MSNRFEDFLDALEREAKEPEWPMETESCLPFYRLAPWSVGTLTAAEEAHLQGCGACQRRVGVGWRVQCPSPNALVEFANDPAASRYGDALAVHLGEDQCEACHALLQRPWLKRATIAFGMLRKAKSGFAELARKVQAEGRTVLVLPGEMVLGHEVRDAGVAASVEPELVWEDANFRVVRQRQARGQWRYRITALNQSWRGRAVRVELVGEVATVEVVETLQGPMGQEPRLDVEFDDELGHEKGMCVQLIGSSSPKESSNGDAQ